MTVIGEWTGKGDAEWRTELGYDRGLEPRARLARDIPRRFNKVQMTGFGEVASDGSVAASIARSPSASGRNRTAAGACRAKNSQAAAR